MIKELSIAGGGEVLMYPHIEDVFTDIAKYKFKTIITSNFSIISDYHRNLLKEMNVEFVISIDGSTKTMQEFLRPNCDYDRIIDNIKFFKKHKKKMMFQTTVSSSNFYDIENMIKLGEDLGVDMVKFQEVHLLDNLEQPYKISKPVEDLDYLNNVFNKEHKVKVSAFLSFYHTPCITLPPILRAPYRFFYKFRPRNKYCHNTVNTLKIQEDGEILSCCLPHSKRMGNLHNDILENIIGSKDFDRNREFCMCPIREMLKERRWLKRTKS
jgi:MoaA/NifB/PqqE/SkfB family radical SAM enzyme